MRGRWNGEASPPDPHQRPRGLWTPRRRRAPGQARCRETCCAGRCAGGILPIAQRSKRRPSNIVGIAGDPIGHAQHGRREPEKAGGDPPCGGGLRMSATTWDAAQYLRFEGERLRPAIDLIGRIRIRHRSVSRSRLRCRQCRRRRRALSRRHHHRLIVPPRCSPRQRQRISLRRLTSPPGCRPPVDVLFSNAALQWLGEHDTLLRACDRHAGWRAGGRCRRCTPNHCARSRTASRVTVPGQQACHA